MSTLATRQMRIFAAAILVFLNQQANAQICKWICCCCCCGGDSDNEQPGGGSGSDVENRCTNGYIMVCEGVANGTLTPENYQQWEAENVQRFGASLTDEEKAVMREWMNGGAAPTTEVIRGPVATEQADRAPSNGGGSGGDHQQGQQQTDQEDRQQGGEEDQQRSSTSGGSFLSTSWARAPYQLHMNATSTQGSSTRSQSLGDLTHDEIVARERAELGAVQNRFGRSSARNQEEQPAQRQPPRQTTPAPQTRPQQTRPQSQSRPQTQPQTQPRPQTQTQPRPQTRPEPPRQQYRNVNYNISYQVRYVEDGMPQSKSDGAQGNFSIEADKTVNELVAKFRQTLGDKHAAHWKVTIPAPKGSKKLHQVWDSDITITSTGIRGL